ncbi:DUF3990 domain-containing protein [Achromobacter xylosoxidans]
MPYKEQMRRAFGFLGEASQGLLKGGINSATTAAMDLVKLSAQAATIRGLAMSGDTSPSTWFDRAQDATSGYWNGRLVQYDGRLQEVTGLAGEVVGPGMVAKPLSLGAKATVGAFGTSAKFGRELGPVAGEMLGGVLQKQGLMPAILPKESRFIGGDIVAKNPDDFILFYHGTSPEKATAIRLEGIDIGKSKLWNDFGEGFYMTTSREEALHSAAMANTSQDVVVFAVPKSELARLDSKVFKNADAEWVDFVSMNKNLNSARYVPPDEWRYTFDMVTGPMFGSVRKDGSLRTLPGRGDQTSIHTQKAADLFNFYMLKGDLP